MARRLSPGDRPDGRGPRRRARDGDVRARSPTDDAAIRAALTEVLAEHDEAILRAFVARRGRRSRTARLREQLAAQTGGPRSTRCSSARPRRGVGDRRAARPAIDELLPARDGRSRRPTVSGPRVQDRADRRRASASPTSACSPARSGRASACASAEGERGEADLDQGLRPGRRAAPRRRSPPARWPRSAGSARSGSATRSASRRRASEATARFPRPALEAVVFAAAARAAGLAPRGPRTSSPSRTRSSTSARTTTATRSRSRSTARSRRRSSRRRSSATTASPPTSARRRRCASSARRGVGEAEEVIRAKTQDEHHRPELAAEHEPVHGDAGPPDRAAAARVRRSSSGSTSSRGCVPLYLFKTAEAFVAQMEAYVREALDGGPRRLAGDRLPGHDDRLRLRVAGHDAGRLPPADAARADDRARPGRDVGLRAARRPRPRDAVVDGAGRRSRRSAGSAAGSAASSRRTACRRSTRCCRSRGSASLQHQLPGLSMGEGILETRPAATSRSATTRRRGRDRGPSPLDRDAWLASLAHRG